MNSENLSRLIKLDSLSNHRDTGIVHKRSPVPNSKNLENSLRIEVIMAYNFVQKQFNTGRRKIDSRSAQNFIRSVSNLFIQDIDLLPVIHLLFLNTLPGSC